MIQRHSQVPSAFARARFSLNAASRAVAFFRFLVGVSEPSESLTTQQKDLDV